MTMPKLNKCRFGEIMHAFEGKWFQKIGTNPNNYRLKEPVLNLKSLCGVAGFSVITPPNLNRFGWNLEYKCGTTVHTRTKKLCQMPPKCVLFLSVTNTMRPFRHISCTDFNYVWNNRCESVCQSVHPWEISKFLHRGFVSPKKLPPEAVFKMRCLLPAYSSNSTVLGDSNQFGGLVDIERMCFCKRVLIGDVQFGHYDLPK